MLFRSATYNYYGNGIVSVLGSAKQHIEYYYYHKYDRYSVARFREKDVVYVKSSALKGKLEKVVIKRTMIQNTQKTFYKNNNMYQDMMNSLYREDELIFLEDAKKLALHFWQLRRAQLVDIINQKNKDVP